METKTQDKKYSPEVYRTMARLELEPDECFTAEEKAVSYNRMRRAIKKQGKE